MGGRAWTRAEDLRLLELRDRGRTLADVGRELGRTPRAAQVRWSRLTCGLSPWSLSPAGAAHLLGASRHSVTHWIQWGWLTARRDRGHRRGAPSSVSRRKGEWRISRADLEGFCAEERFWPLWDPAAVRDAGMRLWATELRAGVRFLTAGEVAERLSYRREWVTKLLAAGRLPGIKLRPGPGDSAASTWWVRADDVDRILAARARDDEIVRAPRGADRAA